MWRGLVQAAYPAARTKGSYMKALFYRIAARRGKQWAAVAVGRTILEIAYQLIARETVYEDLGVAYLDELDRTRTTKRLVRRLGTLGFEVQLNERIVTQAA